MKPLSTDGRVAEPAEIPAACAPDSNRGESVQAAGNIPPIPPEMLCMNCGKSVDPNSALMHKSTAHGISMKRVFETTSGPYCCLECLREHYPQVPKPPQPQHPRLPTDDEDES